MDFGWTSAQEELHSGTRAFAAGRLSALVAARPAGGPFSRAEWEACGEHGLLGLSVSEDYGGGGLDALTTARVIEALGSGCDSEGLSFAIGAHLFACCMPLCEQGSPELKRAFLPRLCSGEWVGANAISESGAGSDLSAIATRASRDGDHYVLDGEKNYVTNAVEADAFLVYATTNPEHGFMGITAFMVERDRPGLLVGEPFRKVGLTGAPTSSTYFEGCRVPADHVVGVEGQGLKVFNRSMTWERTCLFAAYVGAMERAIERAIEHANSRKQFRRPIGKNQAVSHRIVDMKLRLEAARLLLYRACWSMDQGESATLESSLAKIAVSEAAVQTGLDAIQIHGGMGVMLETGVPRSLLDALPSTIFSGTSELQRNIAAAELGL